METDLIRSQLKKYLRIVKEGSIRFKGFLLGVGNNFLEDRCLLMASALTYTSLLSLVPLLAIMFSILKGLGVQKRLEPVILDRFALGSKEIVSHILQYIDKTNVSSLGVIGMISLIATSILVLKNVEMAFNQIWKVRKGRTFIRTVTDYISCLTITPILMLLAFTLTGYFSSKKFLDWISSMGIMNDLFSLALLMTPYVIMWIAFTSVYLFMPNTRVRIVPALVGGIVGGTLWQFAQWTYVHYQIGMSRYNAIYGALSQLPILLVWLYVSWVILLLGAEIAYALHYKAQLPPQKRLRIGDPIQRAYWLLKTLIEIGRRFHEGKEPFKLSELSHALGIPSAELLPLLEFLHKMDAITTSAEDNAPIQPKKPLEKIHISDILQPLSASRLHAGDIEDQQEHYISMLLERQAKAAREALKGLTLKEILALPDEQAG